MDSLLTFVGRTLPEEISVELRDRLLDLEQANFEAIFRLSLVKVLLGRQQSTELERLSLDAFGHKWNDFIFERLGALLSNRIADKDAIEEHPLYLQYMFFLVAIAALQAFIQSNITGPPLPFKSADILFPEDVARDDLRISKIRKELLDSLVVDGVAPYRLTPNIELLCLADTILTCPPIKKNIKASAWAALRTNFMHQRILSETSPKLEEAIYDGLDITDTSIELNSPRSNLIDLHPRYLLEKATIHTHHGMEKKARSALAEAAGLRGFKYALTGRLGKRTKFQEKDTSQLVVLARSKEESTQSGLEEFEAKENKPSQASQPLKLDLNDDTLLESISFSNKSDSQAEIVDSASLTPELSSLDPEHQPLLHPLDSINMLALASTITNTSPADGLTREETLPYALRVLDGGSSNWQVYTQALLVRSRIESHRPRTTERGLLQLQALVDQVIAETSEDHPNKSSSPDAPTTFLPQASASESAPTKERLLYVYELCPPTRWELESELAARWVSLGGLRTALEIYARLELWAEEALCWAAVDREDKAKKIVRKQLFHATDCNDEDANIDEELWEGSAREPPPSDAPRLYCILGDIDNDVSMYEKAWSVSNNRYARAQRSIGRHHFSRGNFIEAASAYSKAVQINHLNQSSWFALGCVLLELSAFERAAEVFARAVQLDDTDAESWSNLAIALLRKEATPPQNGSEQVTTTETGSEADDAVVSHQRPRDPQKNVRDALQALKRAASLKYESHRIWDNLLTVATSLKPPAYPEMVTAMQRIIDLRGPVEGEKCIDVSVLELLVRHIISSEPTDSTGETGTPQQEQRGLPRLVLSMFDTKVVPLITSSARLWRLAATVALWRGKPGEALAANEKAWRIVSNASSGWETGTPEQWEEVVGATEELCDAYESLGTREGSEGQGESVASDWRFKARSAIRGVMSRAKSSWEGSDGWERLEARLKELKASRA